MSLANDFFDTVNTEGKAYVLGWIAAKGSIHQQGIEIRLNYSMVRFLETLRGIIDKELPIGELQEEIPKSNTDEAKTGKRKVFLTLASSKIKQKVCEWLQVAPTSTTFAEAKLPALAQDDLLWSFIRGIFDANGTMSHTGQTDRLECSLEVASAELLSAIQHFAKIPVALVQANNSKCLVLQGHNALDFLGNLYDNATFALPLHKTQFLNWCICIAGLNSAVSSLPNGLNFQWVKTSEDAVPPFKGRISDSGYDLTLIAKVKEVGGVTFYDTGIQIQPEFGWYFDLVPRSSISKSGYMLANNVGIIDRTYTGNVLVPLIKIDKNMPDLTLPARIVQIIPRPIVHGQWHQVESFEATERGAGGFGSSGK